MDDGGDDDADDDGDNDHESEGDTNTQHKTEKYEWNEKCEIGKIKIGKRKFITLDASKPKEIIHKEIVENIKRCKLIR